MIFDVDEYAKKNPEKADPLLKALNYLIGTDERGVARGGAIRADVASDVSTAVGKVGSAVGSALAPAAEAVTSAIMKAVNAKRFADARSLARKYNKKKDETDPGAPGISVDKLMKRPRAKEEKE